MSGFGNMQVLRATSEEVCEYYERGLIGPGVDYDITPPYLKAPCDPIGLDGYVTVPTAPGLGYEINWHDIDDHRIAETHVDAIAPLHPR
jgi:L-alanine-DL-glutamate epimerase-like enolase superfamily enzyme